MWNRIKHWWTAEGALAELQGASDRMLADMGLKRDGLRAQVHGRTDAAPAPVKMPGSCVCHPLQAAQAK